MSSPINDGGPAFPQTYDSWYRSNDNLPVPTGMSLRDYFAAKALEGLCSNGEVGLGTAIESYKLADEMLKARLL